MLSSLKSPYIQNCTNFADSSIDNRDAEFNPDYLGGEGSDTTSAPTGGGILCDGSRCSSASPLRSFVVDAFTQVTLDGPGILCINNGYAQLVSFFGTFCHYHAKALNGGQLNLSNCTTDFGRYGLIADGRSPDPIYKARTKGATAKGVAASNVKVTEITAATYDSSTGIIQCTATAHGGKSGDIVKLSGLKFSRTGGTDVLVPPTFSSNKYVLTEIDANTFSIVFTSGFGTLTYKSADPGFCEIPVAGGNAATLATEIVIDTINSQLIGKGGWSPPRKAEPGVTQLIKIGNVFYPILSASESSTTPGEWTIEVYSPQSQFDRRNLGLQPVAHNGEAATASIPDDTECQFFLQSYISTGGHTFEFVGSGTNYNAHPDFGGRAIPANEAVERGGDDTSGTTPLLSEYNGGRTWISSTNETGTFQVGNTFQVDQKTGLINFDPTVIVNPDLVINEDLDMNGYRIINTSGTNKSGQSSYAGRIAIVPDGDEPLIIGSDPTLNGSTKERNSGVSPILEPIRERSLNPATSKQDWDVITHEDVGIDANEVPLAGQLGKLAFYDNLPHLYTNAQNPTNAGEIKFNINEGANTLDITVKYTDGSLKSASIALT